MVNRVALVSGIVGMLVGAAALGLVLRVPVALAQERPLVGPFVDTHGHPAAEAIEELRLAGLTSGCSTNPPMFCPDRPLTRGEAAVFLARLLVLMGERR